MMKAKRRALALLLALTLLLPMTLPALAAEKQTFTDVSPTFWGYDAIQRCADEGIVIGVGNDMFASDMTLT